eukprot:6307946-Alexandrium_andersonii.AAC.1
MRQSGTGSQRLAAPGPTAGLGATPTGRPPPSRSRRTPSRWTPMCCPASTAGRRNGQRMRSQMSRSSRLGQGANGCAGRL